MDQSFDGLNHICLAYIDDILILRVKDVETVLLRVKEKGIVISIKKSTICQKEIEYLGIILKENG